MATINGLFDHVDDDIFEGIDFSDTENLNNTNSPVTNLTEDEAEDAVQDAVQDEVQDVIMQDLQERRENLFTGGINREMAYGIVDTFLQHWSKAPTFVEFQDVYKHRETEQKKYIYRKHRCTYKFEYFCTDQRNKYKEKLKRTNATISFKTYRKRRCADKHRVLKSMYVEQLLQKINSNVTKV